MPMNMLLAAFLVFQTAEADSGKLEEGLKRFGDRVYRVLSKGKEIGALSLKTRVATEEGKKLAVFEDRLELIQEETKIVFEVTERASLPGLRLVSVHRTDTAGAVKTETIASVSQGDAYISSGDRKVMIKTTDAAMGEEALVRHLCLQEQKVGASFKADVLSLDRERLEEERELKCVAKESVEIGGAKRDAFKWEEAPADPKSAPRHFWISPDGYPLKVAANGLDYVLQAK